MLHSRAAIIGWFYAICVGVFITSANSHAAMATITFDSPRGGEVYAPGQTQKVRLGSKTPAKVVKIELSRDGGTTFELLGSIDNTVKDATLRNALSFTVAGISSSNCLIRASGTVGKSIVSVLSSPFTIGAVGIADGSVSPAKITSGASSNGFILTADGSGGANFAPPALDGRYVKVAGDAMTGLLTLSGNPTVGLQAATKQYVDAETARAQTAETAKVAKTGDTMTGALVLPTNGLAVGASQLTLANGNVGVGTNASLSNALVVQKTVGATIDVSFAQHILQTEIRSGVDLVNPKAMAIGVLDNGQGMIQVKQVNVGYNDLLLNPVLGNVCIGTPTAAATLTVSGQNFQSIAAFQNVGVNVARIDQTGKGFFNGISNAGITSLFFGANVPSAITVSPSGNIFTMNAGTNNVVIIDGSGIQAGTFITIICQSPPFQFTTGGNLHLQGNVNFTTSTNATITFVWSGSAWFEVCRSVN